jgi:hypothetical protein
VRPFDPKTYLVEVLGPYVGASETLIPDVFERYLLEPGDADERAIATRMGDVKTLWDKRVEHPKYGQLIRTLAAAHVEAELTLGDPGERARQAAQAAERARERSEKAAEALAGWRSLLADHVAASGGLDPARRGQLERMAAKQGLDPAIVQRELDAAPVAKMPEVLAESRRQRVRKALSELAQDVGEPRLALSLYHALGLEITEDVALVQTRHKAAVEANAKRAIGTTATLFKNALAEAKLLLVDADPRAYIEGLVLDVEDAMEFEAAQAAASGNVIDEVEAEQLLRRAIELGLTPELGRRVVNELAKDNGVSVQIGGAVDYVACPSCNAPHPRTSALDRCRRCGTALFVVCPAGDCGTRNEATAWRCSNCRTDLQRYTDATRRLATLPSAVAGGRIAWAAAELAEIVRVLGDAAVAADLRRRIEEAERAARAQWSAIERAIGERRLFAARTLLRRLAKDASDLPGPSGELPATREQDVDRRLGELDALLVRARALSGARRERALVEALELAADCEEASIALDAIPPGPPGTVRVEAEPAGPALGWAPSPTVAVRYAVRRRDVRSGADVDLGETQATHFEDRDAATGALVRYEVAAVRGRGRSTAASSPALIVAREVEGLSLRAGDGEVRLAWEPVPASARVLVFRRAGGEPAERALVADRNGLVDRNVRNGLQYAYRVSVEYSADGSQTQRTAGLTLYGQPSQPPVGVDRLTIRQLPDGIAVQFPAPPFGDVAVLRCDAEPEIELGSAVDPAHLPDLGRILPIDESGARDASPGGVCWYLPVTLAGGTAVAGRAHRHLAIADITNVKAVECPGGVRVTWGWPDAVRLAKVIWRRDRQPTGPDDDAESAWVRLGEYRDHGGFAIDAPGSAPVFIAVAPATRVDGTPVAGATISRRARAAIRPTAKIELRYEVHRAGLRRRRLEVEVHAPLGTDAPGLVLVARDGDLLPRHASDGEVIARLGGGRPLTSTIDLGRRPRPVAVRLCLDATAAAHAYRLFDPPADDLLIS